MPEYKSLSRYAEDVNWKNRRTGMGKMVFECLSVYSENEDLYQGLATYLYVMHLTMHPPFLPFPTTGTTY